MEKNIRDINLNDFGFIDDTLETKHHVVSYIFYDIGRLIITSKEKHGADSVYIEDFFKMQKFIDVIFHITGHKIKHV